MFRGQQPLAPVPLDTVAPWLHVEPPLEEMLADPIVRAVMRCDGVDRAEVSRMMAALRRHRTGRPHRRPTT
ncbi:MAG: hypothetical protein H6906_15830 [Hyphomicrobiales bacterium]|nr:hypothetical protein [Hyphomicrobiales bacterium]